MSLGKDGWPTDETVVKWRDAEIEQLKAERDALREDAERLRKMRDGLGAACDLSAARAEKAEAELADLQRSIADLSHPNMKMLLVERDALRRKLNDLMAVIHCDGGHHREAVGDEQAWSDAMQKVSDERLRYDFNSVAASARELREANTKLVGAIDLIRETLNGGEVQDLHQIINAALAEYKAAQKPSKAQEFGTDIWAGLV